MERLRFGMSSCGMQDLTEQNLSDFQKVGLKELELSFASDRYDSLDWEAIKEKTERHGIHLWSCHLPFGPYSRVLASSRDKEVRNNTVKYWGELVKRAASIGIEVMIVHPSGEPNREEERGELMKCAQDSLVRLAEIADTCGALIAVENLPRTCLGRDSGEMKRLISVDERLRICFDTNHLLTQPIKDFILDVGDKIVTTHFSDYDFIDERHWLPGDGKIDWKEVVETLEAIEYKGPILYELGFEAPPTIERRLLTSEDFKYNHYLLKNKLPITALGRPKI